MRRVWCGPSGQTLCAVSLNSGGTAPLCVIVALDSMIGSKAQKCELDSKSVDPVSWCWVGGSACQLGVEESRANNATWNTTRWTFSVEQKLQDIYKICIFLQTCRQDLHIFANKKVTRRRCSNKHNVYAVPGHFCDFARYKQQKTNWKHTAKMQVSAIVCIHLGTTRRNVLW